MKYLNKVKALISLAILFAVFTGLTGNGVIAKKDDTNNNVRALYVIADVAAQRLDDRYVRKYAEYINALREGNNAKANNLISDFAGISGFEKIVGLIIATDLNAVVINVKDDSGYVTIPCESEYVKYANSCNFMLNDIENIIEKLHSYDIYAIARIVVFKDDVLAKKDDHTIKYEDGTPWKDYSNAKWVDPYDMWVHEYNIDVACFAAKAGFDEIQFDYVRFPEKFSQYGVSKRYLLNNIRPDEQIALFLKNAYEKLGKYDVFVAADVFGCVAYLWDDQLNIDIGQVWYNFTQYVDYICPMVYPSHYRGTKWYTYDDPNQRPYEVVKGAIEDSLYINSAFSDKAKIRFWLQDFSMYGYEYGPNQIFDQIRALNEKGIDSYMFWNNKNVYEPENYFVLDNREIENTDMKYFVYDFKSETPKIAVQRYIQANMEKDAYELFVIQTTNGKNRVYKGFLGNLTFLDISRYEITDIKQSFNTAQAFVKIQDTKGNTLDFVIFLVIEKGFWKIYGHYNIVK